jgi:hypothetical protein
MSAKKVRARQSEYYQQRRRSRVEALMLSPERKDAMDVDE